MLDWQLSRRPFTVVCSMWGQISIYTTNTMWSHAMIFSEVPCKYIGTWSTKQYYLMLHCSHNNSVCHLYVADNSLSRLYICLQILSNSFKPPVWITLSFDLNTYLPFVCMCVCLCCMLVLFKWLLQGLASFALGHTVFCQFSVSRQPLPRTEAPQVVSHMRPFFHVWRQLTHGVFLGHSGHPLKSCFMSLAQMACAGSCTDLVPNLIWVVINILHGQYNQYYSGI